MTEVSATVSAPGPSGERIQVKLLIDSGALYTLLPEQVWRRLGLTPTRSMEFSMADLTTMVRGISECYIDLGDVEGERLAGHTTVILGEGADAALLGVVTLEGLGLVLDPLRRSIRKGTRWPLMRVA